MIFIAKVDNNYFLKGWFKVGYKLDYISALLQFPDRQNVIISKTQSTKSIQWRYEKLKTSFQNKNGHTIPTFLSDLQTKDGTFYQSKTDGHQTDNWKCRRIFGCKSKQFESCILANACLKSDSSLKEEKYMNYIVADKDNWQDLDTLRITFDAIVKETNFPTPIRTPKGQHNVLRFDGYEQKLFNLIENHKKKSSD